MKPNLSRGSSVASRSSESRLSHLVDLVGVAGALPLFSLAFLWLPEGSVLRAFLALPFLFFLPGYAVVAALFPRRSGGDERAEAQNRGLGGRSRAAGRSIRWTERAALSLGVSLALVPVLGVVLAFANVELATLSMVIGVDLIVAAGAAVALSRRLRLPEPERFRVPYRSLGDDLLAPFAGTRSLRHRLLSALLIVLVVSSLAGFGYGLAAKPSAERYTGLSLVTQTDSGEFVAGGYPTNLTRGENASVVVGIENHEGSTVSYTVVPVLQRIDGSGGSFTVREQTRLGSIRVTLEPNETAYRRHTFSPTMVGEDLRLAYILYKGDPPRNPTVDSGYRFVHVWVTVEPRGEASTQSAPETSESNAAATAASTASGNDPNATNDRGNAPTTANAANATTAASTTTTTTTATTTATTTTTTTATTTTTTATATTTADDDRDDRDDDGDRVAESDERIGRERIDGDGRWRNRVGRVVTTLIGG
jgi:uncharacterized membrane protein